MQELWVYDSEIWHQIEEVGAGSVVGMVKRGIIPKPESNFLRVRCSKCSNEQIIFERCSTVVKCTVCDETLAEPSGGRASVKGEVIQILS